jgi:hypothetical protein
VAKGGRVLEGRRSSSRERRVLEDGCAVSFVLRRGRDARRGCRWKAPRIGKAHAFHEAPAEPILAASGTMCGFEEKRAHASGPEEATGVSEAVGVSSLTRWKKTPPWESRPVAEVGAAP